MFTIKVTVEQVSLNGLEAIDFVRSFGLEPTGAMASIVNQSIHAEVDEPFARLWFDRSQTTSIVSIPATMLAPGDLVHSQSGSSFALYLADIAPARVRDLYVAGRFLDLRGELEEALGEPHEGS